MLQLLACQRSEHLSIKDERCEGNLFLVFFFSKSNQKKMTKLVLVAAVLVAAVQITAAFSFFGMFEGRPSQEGYVFKFSSKLCGKNTEFYIGDEKHEAEDFGTYKLVQIPKEQPTDTFKIGLEGSLETLNVILMPNKNSYIYGITKDYLYCDEKLSCYQMELDSKPETKTNDRASYFYETHRSILPH